MNTVIVTNGYLAKDPIFYPGATPDNHRTSMTIIDNRGKNDAGVAKTTSIEVSVWGKYAQVAACHLHMGRCISFKGELRSFLKDLGVNKPNGKPAKYTRMEVRIDRFVFGAETVNEAKARIRPILAECESKGIKPTEEMLAAKPPRRKTVDYNPALAAATGKYGYARVWDKATNWFMQPGAAVPQVAAPAAAVVNAAPANESVDDLEKRLAAMKAEQAKAMVAGEGEQNPFEV